MHLGINSEDRKQLYACPLLLLFKLAVPISHWIKFCGLNTDRLIRSRGANAVGLISNAGFLCLKPFVSRA